MIKNVVFDFGRVLVNFDPEYMTAKYVETAEDIALVKDVVFDRLYWDKLDSGDITDEEVVAACKDRLPERLWKSAENAYFNWIYNIPEIDGMRELTLKLKEEYGVRLFLLSNISTYFVAHKDEFSILEPFEHCVFSASVGRVKPNRDIFEYLCDFCGIIPSETIFIDDNVSNVNAANDFGISAYLFDGDAERLSKYLDGILQK